MEEKCYRAELTGCFGDPVDENPTGVIEETGYKIQNLNFRYLTIRVEREKLKEAVDGAKAMGFKGFNLTIPHKVNVIPMLDELTEAAKIIGAVNTVINKDGRLIGENTDGKGFLTSLLENGIDPKGKTVTLLGAGGAARAIGVELGLPHELVFKVPIDGLTPLTDEENLGFTYDALDRYIRTGVCEDESVKANIDHRHAVNLFKLELMPAFEYGGSIKA